MNFLLAAHEIKKRFVLFSIEHEVQDYLGLASHPFMWEESVEKFDNLVTGRVDDGLSRKIKDAVRHSKILRSGT